MFAWLSHQFYLTLDQVKQDVTIPHIVTGLILYGIIHSAAKNGQMAGTRTKKLFRSEMQRYIYRHVELGHKGHPIKCKDLDCQPIQILIDPQLRD